MRKRMRRATDTHTTFAQILAIAIGLTAFVYAVHVSPLIAP